MDQRGERPTEPIIHLDMDAFYAAVEVRDDPRLRGRCVLVGGTGGRGVVASPSYEARAFGVTSAMPMTEALRRCPGAVVVAPRFDVYAAVSRDLHTILRAATPLVEPLALDEAFLDVGGSVRLLGSPVEIASMLRARIAAELGLPASVGVAPNKFLAKLCSAKAKPDGLLHVPADRVDAFLVELPVRDLWGAGPETCARLENVGIRTVADLRAVDPATLQRLVGAAAGHTLRSLAHGHDNRRVEPRADAKGLSAEQTFAQDLTGAAQVRHALLVLCERVARRLRHNGVRARTITLKVRYGSFQTVTRSRTVPVPTCQTTQIHRIVEDLVAQVWAEPTPVRLLGVAASRLVADGQGVQTALLDATRWDAAERVADAVRAAFGDIALTRGALLGDGETASVSRDDLATDDLPER